MATLFSDNFNRADGDSLGSDWAERGDDFDIASNQVVAGTTTSQIGHFYHATAAYGTPDYAVQADYAGNVAGDFGGLLGRRTNGAGVEFTGYAVFINRTDGDVYIYKRTTGFFNLNIFPAAFTGAGTPRTLRLEMEGSAIRAYVNGGAAGSTSDGGITAVGDSGGTNYGTSWDNWLVESFGAAGPIQGAASVALPLVQVSAAGAVALRGAAAITLPLVTVTAAGTVELQGAASLTLPKVQVSAAGSVAIRGEGAVTLPLVTLAAVGGAPAVIAEASVTLPLVVVTAAGAVPGAGGAAAIVLPRLTLAAAGGAMVVGEAAILLPLVTVTGSNVPTLVLETIDRDLEFTRSIGRDLEFARELTLTLKF